MDYVKANGLTESQVTITTPVGSDSKKIKVLTKRTVSHTMARMIGINETDVAAAAIAETIIGGWAWESLPFINIAFDYSTTDPIAWTKVGPGIKGTIQDFFTKKNGSKTYFEIDYKDGITVTPGFSNGQKGLDDSKLKDGLDKLISHADENVKVLYMFSLRADIIKSGKFTVNNKTGTVELDELNKLKNGDVIDPYQLVLIQCLFTGVGGNYNNMHSIELKYLNNVYDLGNNVSGKDLPDFPTDNISTTTSKSKLIG